MEQYDYDIDQSLRVISGMSNVRREEDDNGGESVSKESIQSNSALRASQQASNVATSSATGSTAPSVSDYGDSKMTLNTRRRLIRKPLPDLPTAQKRDVKDAEADTRVDGALRHAELREVSHSSLFAHHHQKPSKKPGASLSNARQRTRDLNEKERAMLEWWPSVPGSLTGFARDDSTNLQLNTRCRRHLRLIIQSSLQMKLIDAHADTVEALAASIDSAIMACLNTVATPQTLSDLHQTYSVLWRVEALVRSEEQLKDSKGGIANVLDLLGLRWTNFVPWRKAAGSLGDENNIKALSSLEELLSIRPLLASKRTASSSSVNAPINTEQRRRKRDVAMQLLNSAFFTPTSSVLDGATNASDNDRQPTIQKRTNLASPAFALKPATPTVALATKSDDMSYFPQVSQTSTPDRNNDDPPFESSERPSMLADRLSMQLRNASRSNADTNVNQVKAATLRDSSARSSRSSFGLSLESKERQPIQLTACSITYQFEECDLDADTSQDRPSRANTIKGTLRRLENLSTVSGGSDGTVKGGAVGKSDEKQKSSKLGISKVEWSPDRFDGRKLRYNPFAIASDIFSSNADQSLAKSMVVGGTFVVQGVADHEGAISETLEVALYAAISMLLETIFLLDFGLPPADDTIEDVVEGVASSMEEEHAELSLAEQTGDKVEAKEEGSLPDDSHPQWHRGIWHLFGNHHDNSKSDQRDGVSLLQRRERVPHLGRIRKFWHALAPPPASASVSDGADKEDDGNVDHTSESNANDQDAHSDVNDPAAKDTLSIQERPRHLSAYRQDGKISQDSSDLPNALLRSQTLHYATVYGGDLAAHRVPAKKEVMGDCVTAPSGSLVARDGRASFSTVHSSQKLNSGPTPSTPSLKDTGGNTTSTICKPAPLGSIATNDNVRSVLFYGHEDERNADTSLGQALEEMAARTMSLHHTTAKSDKVKAQAVHEADGHCHTFKIAQYLSKRDKVCVCGSLAQSAPVLPTKSGTTTPRHDVSESITDVSSKAEAVKEKADVIIGDESEVGASASAGRPSAGLSRPIFLWHADVRTGRQSVPVAMSDATYLASYAMFVEALMDWDAFTHHSPPLFGDDANDTDALGESDDPKHDLVRMFKIGDVLLKFHVQSVALFDMLIEGPVVLTNTSAQGLEASADVGCVKEVTNPERLVDLTRSEIQDFYASLKRAIAQLEQAFVARELDASGKTIKVDVPSLGRSSVRTIFTDSSDTEISSIAESIAESSSTTYSGAAAEPLDRLGTVASSIRKGEFDLYEALKSSDPDLINDIRTQFHHCAVSAKERLRAWSRKHMTKAELKQVGELVFDEPEYFSNGRHAFPGSRYLLRQDEPLSIIAYSLSSREFKKELAKAGKRPRHDEVRDWRASVAAVFPHHDPFPVLPLNPPAAVRDRNIERSKIKMENLDPDVDENYSTAEPLRVSTKRKTRNKEASMLSLRIRSSAAASDADRSYTNGETPSISERLSHVDDHEDVLRHDVTIDDNSTITNEADNSEAAPSHVSQQASESQNSELGKLDTTGTDLESSACSVSSNSSASTVHNVDAERTPQPSRLLPSKDHTHTKPYGDLTPSRPSIEGQAGPSIPAEARARASPHVKHTLVSGSLKISCVSWFAEEFARLRQQWGVEHDFVASLSRSKMWSNLGGKSKSGFYLSGDDKWIAKQLLNIWTVDEKEAFLEFAPAYLQYMTNSVVNDCPTLLVKIAGVYSLKIKDTKTNEVKLKLSVQVLENVFSGDFGDTIRFDLKGIRERRAIVAAKKAHTESEAQRGSESSVLASSETPSVWWDGEWIDTIGPRAYVKDSDRTLFERALQNDLQFLTASKMMDYSLLVGVNDGGSKEQQKSGVKSSFRVRIVDFLGAWTLVKQLESSGKKAIKNQTPTVIPPHEYASRFRKAMLSYFIGSPS